MTICRTVMLPALLLAASVQAEASDAAPSNSPVVSLEQGAVRGSSSEGYSQFLGIPYAAPPVGDNRWEPPLPPADWSDIRPATTFAPGCPQNASSGVFAKPSAAEDCLYLNVFTQLPAPEARPVLVWIHGGGLYTGDSSAYDPRKLVQDGKLVVVTFNYRLGTLGYYPRKVQKDEPAIANYGLLDQQFLLAWVKRNIAAFGGDPDKVTIAGESAGGDSVYALMASPASAGLFHAAIAQSGGYAPKTPTMEQAAPKGDRFAKAAGCADASMQCLKSVGVERILAAQVDSEAVLVVDGTTLPRSLEDAFQSGNFNRVPVLSGTNSDEALWFLAMEAAASNRNYAGADYAAELQSRFGSARSAVLKHYPLRDYGGVPAAIGAAETALYFVCPQRVFDQAVARWVPLYSYEFNDRTAPSYMPDVGFSLGASHTFELNYLFTGFRGASGRRYDLSPLQQRLSDTMIRYWSRFAATGSPNSPSAGIPAWPRYSRDKETNLSLQTPQPSMVANRSLRYKCRFWDRLKLPGG